MNWKGGRLLRPDGYIYLKMRGHPMSDSQGYIREHRYIMFRHLGRVLEKKENVHHKDGNKTNNSIENLMLIGVGEHVSLEHKLGTYDSIKTTQTAKCPICNKDFQFVKWQNKKFCGNECKNDWLKMPKYSKTCAICRTVFKAHAPNVRYCKPRCRQDAQNLKRRKVTKP